MSRIGVKDGVQPQLIRLVAALANVAQAPAFGGVSEIVITAGIDGLHAPNSLHYALRAIDVRTRNLTDGQQSALVLLLRQELGAAYDVVLEADHVHVEYDPT